MDLTPLRALARVAAIMFAWFVSACTPAGNPDGASCTSAYQCQSLTCTFDSRTGTAGVCARRCTDGVGCAMGQVCGRYDFRGFVPDAGPDGEVIREGPDFEILRVCRARMTQACTVDTECAADSRCMGAPSGVCAQQCSSNAQCAFSGACIAARDGLPACGQPGVCAPACDVPAECPSGWRCELPFGNSVHGRCLPITGNDVDCSSGSDASADVVSER